jgi:hypothetical protein
MKATKAVTIRLEVDEYERLVAEASRLATSPAQLARSYVRAGLAEIDEHGAEARGRLGSEALNELALLRRRLPTSDTIDVVALVREGRDELERRMAL